MEMGQTGTIALRFSANVLNVKPSGKSEFLESVFRIYNK